MTSALAFQQVHKRYAKVEVLRGIALEVAQGAFFGLAGVNGAGKTTLLKCLLDFSTVDAGQIRVYDTAATIPAARARLAFLPERFVPPYYLTGGEFLRYMLTLYGVTYQSTAVLDICTALDLDATALAKPVRNFSKGMTQKLGLAACFLSQRELLILDEPMSGLDPKARALLKQQLLRLKGQGRTLMFTSHALHDIDELCDEMAVLHAGCIRFQGKPAELCRVWGGTLEDAFLSCISAPEEDL